MKNVKNGTKAILWGVTVLGTIVLAGISGGNLGKTIANILVEKQGEA